ncbi:hypothetical protein DICPUDRAFT_150014 [Dictyostelium purpureum]|uniref:Importin N-terminal domain-containing protein n=1 Tax=Dictyostelium purpureum TaxID=5786 RepID=F0ZF85_DICPU|nr:uncharacterized protein DICPUDRAFT_150014 [Dictyostelium purpureum]EGC37408.1 hypothetical protein DICPUDRAFT_150014 [Dictyostelium purpureum]|eukprot:XP_003286061.1 hypothetical protein DICPUDRAFT_150014 [Dictyostelium purpureum]
MDQLEYSRIVEILTTCLNCNNDVRKAAEDQLVHLKKQQGFSKYLLEIFGDQNIFYGARHLAAISFKSLVIAHWKKGSLFTEEEKNIYRDKLLVLLNNPNETCTEGIEILAVSIGKIARNDYPSQWPNLMNVLLEIFEKSTSDRVKITSLRVIKFVIKEVASKRWFGDRDFFTQLSKNTFGYFINVWKDGTKKLIELLISSQDLGQYKTSLIMLLNSITKILRRVVEYGYTDYQSSEEICKYYFDIFSIVPEIMKYRLTIKDSSVLELIDKFVFLNQKILLRSQHVQPLSFIKLLTPTLQFFSNQILLFNPHDTSKKEWNSSKQFLLVITQGINFMREVVNCSSYQSSYDDPDQDEIERIGTLAEKNQNKEHLTPINLAQNSIKGFFNHDNLSSILKALVSNCLIINSEEMERWESEPEEYIQELQVEDVYFELKPASYNLFILLMRHFHEDCVDIVIKMLEYITSPSFDSRQVQLNTEQICLKEACYMTIGLGYYDLIEKVNFSDIFLKVFVPELQSTDPRFKIIKRRILWLVCYWIGKIPDQLKDDLVRLLLGFLKDSDMVVALTAMDAVKSYIDDLEFDYVAYQPYLQDTLQLIIGLFNRTYSATAKSNLLAALGIIFIKFNENIKPFTPLIYKLFESLWNNGEEEAMVKSAVLRSFSFFLQALNNDPTLFFPLLLPIINFSISDKDSVLYLREDGLELWFQTMVRVPSLNSSNTALLELFNHWPTIMSETLEFGEQCFKILDTYLLLGQIDFLRFYGSKVSYTIESVLDESFHDWYERVIKSIDRILQIVQPTTDAIIMLEACINKILKMVICGNEEDNSIVMVDYLSVFSRILTMDPTAFFKILDHIPLQYFKQDSEDDSLGSKPIPTTRKELYSTFFDTYFEMIDRTGSLEQRKLIGIGLSNLLTVPREEVLELLGTIISMVVGVRGDLVDVTQDSYCNDGTVLSQETSGVQIQADKIFNNDPINKINLSTYLYQKIQESSNVFGIQNFENAIKNVHPSVLELAKPPPQ